MAATQQTPGADSPMVVLIPTCRRSELLGRTLSSLAACGRPAGLKQVIVVENGARLGAEAIVTDFVSTLPVVYRHVATPSKSVALNTALASLGPEFVIFFDDDVRFDPACLQAYAATLDTHGAGHFFGGRCQVDYEEAPPEWLKAFLPFSAKGWSKGDLEQPLRTPEALGFNWGAFASDLKAVGGFDEDLGPGKHVSVGDETVVQERLLTSGVAGVYVPGATVWHFVPRERCSREWTLRRATQMGRFAGTRFAHLPRLRREALAAVCLVRLQLLALLLHLRARGLSPHRRFYYEQRISWRAGVLEALRFSGAAKAHHAH